MSNRKELKKYVNKVTGNLFAECLATKLYIKSINDANADEVLAEILAIQDDFVCRISHTEPGNVKGFYKKFHEDFNEKINEVIANIDRLLV